MITVRMITTMAGPDGVCPAGSCRTVTPDEAANLAAGGYAVIIGGETATLPPIETATVKKGRKK